MEVQETLIDYITTQLLSEKDSIQLGPDDNLLLSGLVDSFGVVRLAKFMEDSFAIKVKPGEMTLKNFKTVNAITDYVERKTAVTDQAG